MALDPVLVKKFLCEAGLSLPRSSGARLRDQRPVSFVMALSLSSVARDRIPFACAGAGIAGMVTKGLAPHAILAAWVELFEHEQDMLPARILQAAGPDGSVPQGEGWRRIVSVARHLPFWPEQAGLARGRRNSRSGRLWCDPRDHQRFRSGVPGSIPADCWHDPNMAADELRREIGDGATSHCLEQGIAMLGVMGLQDKGNVALIRHAYVSTPCRGRGVGAKLLRHIESTTHKPIMRRMATLLLRSRKKTSFLAPFADFTPRHRQIWSRRRHEGIPGGCPGLGQA